MGIQLCDDTAAGIQTGNVSAHPSSHLSWIQLEVALPVDIGQLQMVNICLVKMEGKPG